MPKEFKQASVDGAENAENKLFNQSPAGIYKLIQQLQPNFVDDKNEFKPVPLKCIQTAAAQSNDLKEAGVNNTAKINYRLKLLIETEYAKKVKIKRTKENFGSGTGFIVRSLDGDYPWKYFMKKNTGHDANELINKKGTENDDETYIESIYQEFRRTPYRDLDLKDETPKGPTGYLSPNKVKQYLRSWLNSTNTNPDFNFTPKQATNYFKHLLTDKNFAGEPLIGRDKGQYVVFEIAKKNFESGNQGPADNENKFVKKTDASKFASGKAEEKDFVYAVEWDGEPNLDSLPPHFKAKLQPLNPKFSENNQGFGIMTFINHNRKYTVPFQGYVAMTGSGRLFGLSTDELEDKYVNVADAGQLSFDQISERIHKKREARNIDANTIERFFKARFDETRSIEASINYIEQTNELSKIVNTQTAEYLKEFLVSPRDLNVRINNNPDDYDDSLKDRFAERPNENYILEKRPKIGEPLKMVYNGPVISQENTIKKIRSIATKAQPVKPNTTNSSSPKQTDAKSDTITESEYGKTIANAFLTTFNETHDEKTAFNAIHKLPREIVDKLDWPEINHYQHGLIDVKTLERYFNRPDINFQGDIQYMIDHYGENMLYRLQRGAFIDNDGSRKRVYDVDYVEPEEVANRIKDFKRYKKDQDKW